MATIISGTQISKEVRAQLGEEVKRMTAAGVRPGLAPPGFGPPGRAATDFRRHTGSERGRYALRDAAPPGGEGCVTPPPSCGSVRPRELGRVCGWS